MIKKNKNTLRSWTRSKRKTKKKKNNSYVFAFEVCSFLSIHAIIFLEFEQTLKDLLDLKICRALIKLLDKTQRKHRKEKER